MLSAHRSESGLYWTEVTPENALATVVLIHGLGGDSGFWSAEQQALGKRFRVLAIDLRGSGKSVATSSAVTINDLADDVVSVLDHAAIKSAHMVGYSMGGVVAQALALTAPRRVKSLVLAATFATTNEQASLFLKAVSSVYRDGASTKQLFDLVLPWLFSLTFLSDPRAAPYKGYPQDASDEPSRTDWLRLLDAQLAFDSRANLSQIKVPTLVICGDQDRLAPASDARQLIEGIPGSVLTMIPGGHLMNIESQAEFISHLEAFLLSASSKAI